MTSMAFSVIEAKKIQRLVGGICKRRSTPDQRDSLRFTYEIRELDVEISASSPRFNKPNEWSKKPCARLKYSRSSRKWKLYWMRPDGQWYPYETETKSNELEALVAEIDRDRAGAFFG
jgi:hypothetical protein